MSTESHCAADRPCTAVQLLVQRQINADKRLDDIEEDVKSIRDRLPPWVLGVGTFGGMLIGVLGTLASK